MDARRRTAAFAGAGLLALAMTAARVTAAGAHVSPLAAGGIEACSLLTTADASKALGATSVPGKRMMPSDPTGCVWSNDPNASDSSRRLVLNTHSASSYKYAKHPAITTIKIEPVAGLGDDAIYQIYPSGPPFIWVLKGSTAISIRIIIGTTPEPFTVAQEKAKLLVLAKAAVARM